MKEERSQENKKVSWKKFRFELLDEDSQDLMEEVMEGIRDKTMTAVINKICTIARKKIRKPEAEHILVLPNCGWVMYHPEYGELCIYGLKKPIRLALLKHRKLKHFDCPLCAILDLKREEAKQLLKIQEKKALKVAPYKIDYGNGYKVKRDLVAFVMKYRTLSPAELVEHIFEIKAVKVSPVSITMWLKRHPDIHEDLKQMLEGDLEAEQKLKKSQEEPKTKTPQEMIEDYQKPMGKKSRKKKSDRNYIR